jgi:large-conductance mechanosensitive channel
MNRIREILLAEYIGAVAIGLILAQAVMTFITTLVNNVVVYWEIQKSGSVLTGNQSFSWKGPITSLVDVGLYLFVAFLMIRWLYLRKNSEEESLADDTRAATE